MPRRLLALVTLTLLVPAIGHAVIPDAVPDLPVLGEQVQRGAGLITHDAPPVAPTPKVVDGQIDDWTGEITRYAGTAIYSHGEYVYQDHIADNFGADAGPDRERAEVLDPLAETEPRTYRVEPIPQLMGEQLGADCDPRLCAYGNYGDVTDRAVRVNTDIEEVRVAADPSNTYLLVRTAGMLDDTSTGVLVLLGVGSEAESHPAPGGIMTTTKRWLLTAGDTVVDSSNVTGAVVATDSSDYINAVEIAIPRAVGDLDGLAVATCAIEPGACKAVASGDAASDLINVAFRFDEPQRIWMEHDQAFALLDGDIDRYAARIDIDRLLGGATETFEPRPGYWERIYESDSPVSIESQNSGSYFQGRFQHYGVYLPSNFRGGSGSRYPTTWWAHYRGGHAHDAAAWVPGLLRHFGEDQGNIMITPSARGTSTWYVGRGMEDFLEVWDDAMASLPIDPDRVYMTGYSMGGFASWLLPTLMPDRFAGASPQEGPATQGLFVAPGIVTAPQNGGDVEAENTYNILENARNLAYVIYNGNTDELVWITGVAAMHAKLTQLGYDNRLYQIDGGEHYVVAILDQWDEAANYLNGFSRDPNPPHVTYRTWPAIEHAVSTIRTPVDLGYRFNRAYWVSGLEAREVATLENGKPDPADWGTIDAITLGRGMDTTTGIPEGGVGVQGSAYQMTGWRNIKTGHVPPSNAFRVSLENLSAATLDLVRMGIANTQPISAKVATDGPTTLTLAGTWNAMPQVEGCSGCVVTLDADGLHIELTADAALQIIPA